MTDNNPDDDLPPGTQILALAEEVVDLQMKVAFQEDLIQKLDDALAEQQQQILQLKKQFSSVFSELRQVQNVLSDFDPPEPPPPHY